MKKLIVYNGLASLIFLTALNAKEYQPQIQQESQNEKVSTQNYSVPTNNNERKDYNYEPRYFIKLNFGSSLSKNANIIAGGDWDLCVEGYNDDLSSSFLVGLGIGYSWSDNWKSNISFNNRSFYEYEKFQTGISPSPNKTRYFKLINNSLMLNITRYLNDHNIQVHDKTLTPYVGLGFGLSTHWMYDFHSKAQNSSRVYSYMLDDLTSSFAYQLSAGGSFNLEERLDLDIGYQYYYGGRFQSNNYVLHDTLYGDSRIVNRWSGRLKAHEFIATLNYKF